MATIAGSDSPACPYQARKQRLSSTSVLVLPGRPPQGPDWAVQRQLGFGTVPSGVRVLCVQQPRFPAGRKGRSPDPGCTRREAVIANRPATRSWHSPQSWAAVPEQAPIQQSHSPAKVSNAELRGCRASLPSPGCTRPAGKWPSLWTPSWRPAGAASCHPKQLVSR